MNILRLSVISVVVMQAGCASMVPVKPGVMAEVLAGAAAERQSAPVNPEDGTSTEGALIPRPLLEHVQRDAREGLRNRVLNDMRAGTAAWEIGAVQHSQILFEDAFAQIETIYADNPTAKLARSNWHEEAVKDFKGEPYERAMVGYYRGLSEMVQGDWDNARASFRWGEYQDTLSASEEYRGDMALLTFLTGWTNACTGRPAQAEEDYLKARSIRGSIAMPARGDNLLLIAETTGAPVKYATGKYNDELRFKPGAGEDINGIVFRVGERNVAGALAEDLFFQASTRGGRPVDAILAGKASFKAGAEATSKVAGTAAAVGMQVSLMQAEMGDYEGATNALGISGLGLLASGLSSGLAQATKPQADTRTWDSLPARIYVATVKVPKKPGLLAATFVDATGNPAGERSMRVHEVGQCYVAWVRNAAVVAEAWDERNPAHWVPLTSTGHAPASTTASAAPDDGAVRRGTPPGSTAGSAGTVFSTF